MNAAAADPQNLSCRARGLHRTGGFSLIEVTLAVAIIGSVLVSLMLVMGMGIDAVSVATRQTTIGHILTDTHHRLEGNPLKDGPIGDGPYFYDVDGVFVPKDAPVEMLDRRTYRVDVELKSPDVNYAPDAKGLKAVVLEVRWPVGPEGKVIGRHVETMTYFVNTLTGPNWEEVDHNYEPVIEL